MSCMSVGSKTLNYALQTLREQRSKPWIIKPVINLGYVMLDDDEVLQALGTRMMALNDATYDAMYAHKCDCDAGDTSPCSFCSDNPTPFTFKPDRDFRLDVVKGIKQLAVWLYNSDHDEDDELYLAIKAVHRELCWSILALWKEYDEQAREYKRYRDALND